MARKQTGIGSESTSETAAVVQRDRRIKPDDGMKVLKMCRDRIDKLDARNKQFVISALKALLDV